MLWRTLCFLAKHMKWIGKRRSELPQASISGDIRDDGAWMESRAEWCLVSHHKYLVVKVIDLEYVVWVESKPYARFQVKFDVLLWQESYPCATTNQASKQAQGASLSRTKRVIAC